MKRQPPRRKTLHPTGRKTVQPMGRKTLQPPGRKRSEPKERKTVHQLRKRLHRPGHHRPQTSATVAKRSLLLSLTRQNLQKRKKPGWLSRKPKGTSRRSAVGA